MGLALIIIGLLLWLALGWQLLGIILVVVGLVLLLAPSPYGFRGRRGSL